ncbi:MAG: tetratricopeptide repeat protein [Deltaproteobacteria bacterium]|nr:tetratricopeptide repeat protein [Deltaproteobacteria bacterium]
MAEKQKHVQLDEIYEFLWGELPDAGKRFIEEHVHHCNMCKEEMKVAKGIVADLVSMGKTVPVGLDKKSIKASVLSKMGEQEIHRNQWGRGLRLVAVSSIAAAALFVVGIWLIMGPDRHQPVITRQADMEQQNGKIPGNETPMYAGKREESGESHVGQGSREIRDHRHGVGEEISVTGKEKEKRVELGFNTGVVLKPGASMIPLTLEKNRIVLRLERGTGFFKVDPGRYAAFEVSTPGAIISVRGTVFMVSIDSEKGTHVRVSDGKVDVKATRAGANVIAVRAGFEVIVPAFGVVSSSDIRPFNDPKLYAFTRSSVFGERTGKPGIAGNVKQNRQLLKVTAGKNKPGRIKSRRPGTAVHHGGIQTASRQKVRGPVIKLSLQEMRQSLDRARSMARSGENGQAVVLLKKALAAAPSKELEAEAHYLLARNFTVLQNYDGALTEYEAAVDMGRGHLAERALYEAALLSKDHIKDNRLTIKLLARYYKLYPNGVFDEEVTYLLCRMKVEAMEVEAAVESCMNYLDRFPRGYRSTETLYLTATMYRQLPGGFEQASDLYQSYLERKDARKKDEALYWKAGCLLQDGRKVEAIKDLNLYLDKFPNGKRAREVKVLLHKLTG